MSVALKLSQHVGFPHLPVLHVHTLLSTRLLKLQTWNTWHSHQMNQNLDKSQFINNVNKYNFKNSHRIEVLLPTVLEIPTKSRHRGIFFEYIVTQISKGSLFSVSTLADSQMYSCKVSCKRGLSHCGSYSCIRAFVQSFYALYSNLSQVCISVDSFWVN